MNSRREFIKLGAASLLGAAGSASFGASEVVLPATGTRSDWCKQAVRLADPVLGAAAARQLKSRMPVEARRGTTDRPLFSHLEAVGRLLAGIAPWLELADDGGEEARARTRLADMAREALDAISDPRSPDFLNFHEGKQPLVDAAFLAQALMRAPGRLWAPLEARVRANVIAALEATRPIAAGENNWKLFATTIEVFLRAQAMPYDKSRLMEGIEKHARWYVGDGVYGDGAHFHWDYYNSFVIHPMLHGALEALSGESPQCDALRLREVARLSRYAAIQERLVAPDGTYPVVGRSIAYRCGAFHALAYASWKGLLPPGLQPAQARSALSAVIRRTLDAPGTFDDQGWLRIGLSGHQPSIGESYISTGSLYLCSCALLPLGLPPGHAFWSAPDAPTTWQKAWSSVDLEADHALGDDA